MKRNKGSLIGNALFVLVAFIIIIAKVVTSAIKDIPPTIIITIFSLVVIAIVAFCLVKHRKKVAEAEQKKKIEREKAEEEARILKEKAELERKKAELERKKKIEAEARAKAEYEKLQIRTMEAILRNKIIFDRMSKYEVKLENSEIKHRSLQSMPYIHTMNITRATNMNIVHDFVAIDVETTGLKPDVNEIVELAAVRFMNGRAVEYFRSYVKPQKGINPEAERINGISAETVKDAPTIEEISGSFLEFIKNSTIVAHNIMFDLKFLFSHGIRFEDENRRYYDTLDLAKKAWPDSLVGYSLAKLTEPLAIYHPNAHGALSDAFACGYLFIKEYYEINGLDILLLDCSIKVPASEWQYFENIGVHIPESKKRELLEEGCDE